MGLTRLQRRIEMVNHLWYFKLVDHWMAKWEAEAYSAYDANFNYVPSEFGKLTNPQPISVTEQLSLEIQFRLERYVSG